METYVITRKDKEEKSKTLFFYDYIFGLPNWGEERNKAKKFSTKEDARKYISDLRHRKTVFGNHYIKGIKIEIV